MSSSHGSGRRGGGRPSRHGSGGGGGGGGGDRGRRQYHHRGGRRGRGHPGGSSHYHQQRRHPNRWQDEPTNPEVLRALEEQRRRHQGGEASGPNADDEEGEARSQEAPTPAPPTSTSTSSSSHPSGPARPLHGFYYDEERRRYFRVDRRRAGAPMAPTSAKGPTQALPPPQPPPLASGTIEITRLLRWREITGRRSLGGRYLADFLGMSAAMRAATVVQRWDSLEDLDVTAGPVVALGGRNGLLELRSYAPSSTAEIGPGALLTSSYFSSPVKSVRWRPHQRVPEYLAFGVMGGANVLSSLMLLRRGEDDDMAAFSSLNFNKTLWTAVGLSVGEHFSVVDASTWQRIKYGRPLSSDLLACCFTPDGRRALVGSRKGWILHADLRSSDHRLSSIGTLSVAVDRTRVLRDGHRLLASDMMGGLSMFDLRRPGGQPLSVLREPLSALSRSGFLVDSTESVCLVADSTTNCIQALSLSGGGPGRPSLHSCKLPLDALQSSMNSLEPFFPPTWSPFGPPSMGPLWPTTLVGSRSTGRVYSIASGRG